ncbi:uncharacterized protein LOC134277230 [Saccostrea cucullata]|uniref:uncharacterized protein LOC134277230 n=1 Tax=Saccostrea cuccullata TaxID=36930 RepID=UPI002ED16E10
MRDLRECSNYRGIMLLSVPDYVLNRILLERMKEAVEPKLHDQQAGFRASRLCADQVASLCIIIEQSLEWKSSLYVNFIYYEKAIDSVDRETLWKILRHCGVPEKLVPLIRNTNQGMICRVAHAGQMSGSFEVKTLMTELKDLDFPMTWLSFHTTNVRSRIKLTLQQHQQERASKST